VAGMAGDMEVLKMRYCWLPACNVGQVVGVWDELWFLDWVDTMQTTTIYFPLCRCTNTNFNDVWFASENVMIVSRIRVGIALCYFHGAQWIAVDNWQTEQYNITIWICTSLMSMSDFIFYVSLMKHRLVVAFLLIFSTTNNKCKH
jgi:hypothetical protein